MYLHQVQQWREKRKLMISKKRMFVNGGGIKENDGGGEFKYYIL
jgi:hypothetical protein